MLRRTGGNQVWASEMNEKEAAHSRLYSFVFGYTQREFVPHPNCLAQVKLDRALQRTDYFSGSYVCGAVAIQTACRMQNIAMDETAFRAVFELMCTVPGLIGPTPGRLHSAACAFAPNTALHQRSTSEWDPFLVWLRAELASGAVPICLIDWGFRNQHYVVVVGIFHGQFNDLTVAVFEGGTLFYCTMREFKTLCWNGTWGLPAYNSISIRQP